MRKFNRVPKEIREDGESNKEENKLAQYIRKHKGKLDKETLALLNNLPGEDAYSWCKDLRSAKQRLEESKQKQLHIDSEDEHCYRELCRRIHVMLSDPSRAMLLEERYEKAFPNTKKKAKEAVLPKKRLSDWWMNAGIILEPKIPASCTAAEDKKQKRSKVSLNLMHYIMSHVLLDDIRRFLSDGTHLACRAAPGKQHIADFFNACRDPDRRALATWPASEELQTGTSTFKPFQCLRHLALIEMVDKTFTDLPHDHNTLLQELASYRGGRLAVRIAKRNAGSGLATISCLQQG